MRNTWEYPLKNLHCDTSLQVQFNLKKKSRFKHQSIIAKCKNKINLVKLGNVGKEMNGCTNEMQDKKKKNILDNTNVILQIMQTYNSFILRFMHITTGKYI